MRGLVVMFLIMLSVVLGIGLLSGFLIGQIDAMQELANSLIESLKKGEPSDAQSAYTLLQQRWDRAAKWWGVVLPHGEMDAVEEQLVEISLAMEEEDWRQGLTCARHLCLALEVIRREEVPKISNIF